MLLNRAVENKKESTVTESKQVSAWEEGMGGTDRMAFQGAGGNSGDKDTSNSHFSVSHFSRLHYHKDTSVGKCKVPF